MYQRFFLYLILFLFIFSTNNLYSDNLKELLISYQGRPAIYEVDKYTGKPYIAYYINDEEFDLLSIQDNKKVTIGVKGFTADGINVAFSQDEIFVAWRPKEMSTGYKYAYFDRYNKKDLTFIDRKIVNTEKDVLLPVRLYKNKDEVLVSWVDERNTRMSTTYMNFSLDNGKKFNETDISVGQGEYLFNTHYNKIFDQHYFFGSGCVSDQTEKKCGIIYKKTDSLINKSYKAGLIQQLTDWSPYLIKSFETPKGIALFWAGAKGIYCATNYDNDTWKIENLPQTNDMAVSNLSFFKDKNDVFYLAASYKKNLDKTVRDDIFLFISKDNALTWSEPIPLRHYPYKSTMATNPEVYVMDDGTIVVFWQDHRYIRGNIFMNYSKDGGKTWLSEDINLSQNPPGSKNDMYPVVRGYKDKIYLIWYQALNDSFRGERKIFYKEVNLK